MARLGYLMDWPPVWLAASLAVVWGFDQVIPWTLFGPGGQVTGGILAAMGVMLMVIAAAQMVAMRTTVIPGRTPSALVTGGIFRLTRNPIYLGDALVLAGAILWWDVALGLPVLLGFVAVIQSRFILPEEATLRALFGADFANWCQRAPRWIGPVGQG